MDDARELLELTASIAADYLESLGERPVFPDVTPEELRESLGGPLPEEPVGARAVVDRACVRGAEPGVVAMGSGRYFGFVIGGALPAALAADWLTSAWDQNAGLYAVGAGGSVVEQVTREWLLELLGLPRGRVDRLRDRRADGERHRAGRGSSRVLRRGRLERRGAMV